MEAGRKFWMSVIFLVLSTIEVVVAMWLKLPIPDGPIASQGGVAMAFIAGNAAVSWAYAGALEKKVSETTTRTITARRASQDDGSEDTP